MNLWRKIKQCCFCLVRFNFFCNFFFFYFSMLEQLLKVLRRRNQNRWSLKCADSRCCSALNIPVVWQWRWWWATSNWLSLSTPQKHWFLSPVTLKDPELFHHLPYPPSLNANQEAHVDVLFAQGSKQNPTDRWIFTENVRQTHWREASSLSLLSVCLSDRPPYHDCTPRDCSERLPFWWTSSFFLSGLTFH